MREPAVEVRQLRKSYGAIRAVDGVSFTVQRGEVFGILGPNGAGKTTTIECIEGLRQPDGGEVLVLGVPRGALSAAIRQRLGIQLQMSGLYPRLTVREVLSLFSSFYERALPVERLLSMVGLEEVQRIQTSKLSGGQRQRLSLALALLNEPEVAFLDEPTTGLDPQARRALWEIVKGLKQEGRTVVITTHYMEEAQELCDRVAIMDHGRIIELDSPQELIRRHFAQTPVELSLPGGPGLSELAGLPAVSSASEENGRYTLYSQDVARTIAALFELAASQGVALEALAIRQPTLEDVFLKLTGRRIRE